MIAAPALSVKADDAPSAYDRFAKHDRLEFPTEGNLSLWELFGPPAETDYIVIKGDTIRFEYAAGVRGLPLTEKDYEDVASELGVDVASIKAVVEIETGRTRRGFNVDSSPVINFDLNVFRTMTRRRKIKLSEYAKSHPLVFERADVGRFGSQQGAQHARLREAMDIDTAAAIEATFWGMFQIGGFNWKLCGTASREEFVERMTRSEYDQLSLFANYIRNTGLLTHLRNKNWAAFARIYNGPSYAARNYHTRMAAAYRKYSKSQSNK